MRLDRMQKLFIFPLSKGGGMWYSTISSFYGDQETGKGGR